MTERLDLNSNTWRQLKAHYTQRLQSLREQNDGIATLETKAVLAGRIAEIKDFLALEHPAPVTEVHPVD